MNQAEQIIKNRWKFVDQLSKSIGTTYYLLQNIGLEEYNSQSKYIWKNIYNGYSGYDKIFVRTPGRFNKNKKTIVVDDINSKSDLNTLIEKNDLRILEAIDEANIWIAQKILSYKQKTINFLEMHHDLEQRIEDNIEAFKELEVTS